LNATVEPPLSRAEDAKRNMAELYSRVAPSYAERGPPRFAYAGRRLVEIAGVRSGDVVLDVATGRGAVLLAAAERVGPTGRALGIDLAAGMVERTAQALASRGLTWAQVRLMDAEQLDLPDQSCTHALCSFAVFFFPDLAKVLHQIGRVLRPRGLAGFAFERGGDPRWAWYEDLLRERGAFDRMAPVPGSGAIRRPGALVEALVSAGFEEAHELVEEVDLPYPSAEAWWESLWTHGSRRALEVLTSNELAEVQAICLERVRAMAEPGGVPERHQFVFVTARRP
jgi:O-methyltransferase/aklanonic acid methyltransferase